MAQTYSVRGAAGNGRAHVDGMMIVTFITT